MKSNIFMPFMFLLLVASSSACINKKAAGQKIVKANPSEVNSSTNSAGANSSNALAGEGKDGQVAAEKDEKVDDSKTEDESKTDQSVTDQTKDDASEYEPPADTVTQTDDSQNDKDGGKIDGGQKDDPICRFFDPTKVVSEVIPGGPAIAINISEYAKGAQITNNAFRFDFIAYKVGGTETWELTWNGAANRYPFKYTAYVTEASSLACKIQAILDSTDQRTKLGCFSDTTSIRMADGHDELIGFIKVGDMVLNPVTGNAQKVVEVLKGPEAKALIEIGYGNSKVVVTENHPFLVSTGLKGALNVKVGEKTISPNGTYSEITTARTLAFAPNQVVYNIRLESANDSNENHMVMGDGIVTGDLYLQRKVEGAQQ